jgi:tRNA G18 (ribose-2'-O)-methylase SpoU
MSKQLSFDDVRPDLEERIQNIQADRNPISLFLDGLQDQQNIGGLFRTADAARIHEVVLYRCPIEFDQKKFKKTARSTLQFVNYRILETEEEMLEYVEANTLVSIEYTDKSTIMSDTEISLPVTLVLGNERHGVSKQMLALSDQAVHFPMLGVQSSLNVCTAGSIAVYEMLRRLG